LIVSDQVNFDDMCITYYKEEHLFTEYTNRSFAKQSVLKVLIAEGVLDKSAYWKTLGLSNGLAYTYPALQLPPELIEIRMR